MSSSLYGWGSAHWKITKAALDVLPANEISHWSPHRSGFRTYCLYPDMGLANKEAKKYLVVVRGRLFHYFPRDNKADYEFFNEGARIYFRKIIAEMRQGHYDEAARYAGALAHALEDLSQPQCHALEGVNGFAWTILDELFTPEDQTWNRAPQSVISLDGNTNFQVDLGDYKPRLLGTHPDEAAFREQALALAADLPALADEMDSTVFEGMLDLLLATETANGQAARAAELRDKE